MWELKKLVGAYACRSHMRQAQLKEDKEWLGGLPVPSYTWRPTKKGGEEGGKEGGAKERGGKGVPSWEGKGEGISVSLSRCCSLLACWLFDAGRIECKCLASEASGIWVTVPDRTAAKARHLIPTVAFQCQTTFARNLKSIFGVYITY